MTKSRYAVLILAFLLYVLFSAVPVSASTWKYSEPAFMMADPDNPEWTIMTCGHVPASVTQDTLGLFLSINVTNIDYFPLPLPIETFMTINYTAPNGSVTQYDLRETNWYWNTGMYPVDLESAIPYQVGTYDIVAGVGAGTCQLIVDPPVVPVHVVSTEYGNGWQKEHFSDGKTAYSNHETYLRWDNQWIPAELVNISNGNWSYTVVDADTKINFTADGKTISIPKANTKFDLSLFKISPSLTYSKTALTNNMVNVNTTVAYLVFPYSLSQIRDYADEHNIRVGRWLFQAGQEHIDIYDDVLVNHTYRNETGQNETHLGVTTLDKNYYQFKIVNGEIRLYFLKAEANKLNGNITFALNSWTVGNGGNAWTGNSSFNNFMLDRNTNHIILPDAVTDGLIMYQKMSGNTGTISYDMNLTSNQNGTLVGGATWTADGYFGKGVSLDGSDDAISMPLSSLTDNLGASTYSLYFYEDDAATFNERFFSKQSAGFTTSYMSSVDKSLLFEIDYATTNLIRQTNANIFTPGVLNFLEITYDGSVNASGIHIFVNGVEAASYQQSVNGVGGRVSDAGQVMYIGNRADFIRGFDGKLKDARIYNRVLTTNELNYIQNNTMLPAGNLTTWYNAGAGYETYQVDVNATSQANSNYTVWYANNSTGSYSQLGGTLTGNNSLTISGTKYQNTDVQVRLAGNTTSTPELIKVTFWTQPAEAGGTLYERTAEETVTVTEGAGRTLYTFRATSDNIAITEGTQRIYYSFRSVSDAATFTEYATATFIDVGEIFTRYANDAIIVVEGATRQLTYVRLTSDSISITEGAQRLLSAFRSVSDTATITDSAVRTAIYNRAVQQAIAVSENVQSSLIAAGELFIRYASDTITVIEGAASSWWEGVYYTVSGYVSNILSSPLEKARVEYTGSGGNYSFTDAAGYYSIIVPSGSDRQILSRAIGYRNATENLDISGNTQQNFTLSERTAGTVTTPGFSVMSGIFMLVVTLILVRLKNKRSD